MRKPAQKTIKALLVTLSALGFTTTAALPEAAKPSCKPVQCPPAGAGTSTWCETASGAGGSGICANRPSIPPGFEVVTGDSIPDPTGGPPISLTAGKHAPVQPLGKGGICCGVAAVATEDVTLYRAWAPSYDEASAAPPGYAAAHQFGSWWSSEQPDLGTHKTYRHDEDLCLNWNSLTVYSACNLPKGTHVFIGPGQSACCPQTCDAADPSSCPTSCPNGVSYLLESHELQIWVPVHPHPTSPHSFNTQKAFDSCRTFVWPR